MYRPTPATFLGAIRKGHLASCPGLTGSLIYKQLAKSITTSMGHLRMHQKQCRSTNLKTAIPLSESLDITSSQKTSNPCTNTMYEKIVSATSMRKTYSNKTGKFTWRSIRRKTAFLFYTITIPTPLCLYQSKNSSQIHIRYLAYLFKQPPW